MTEGGRITTYRYDLSGKAREKQLPGNTVTATTYDALGRIQTILEKTGGNDLSLTLNEYDLASNVRVVEEQYSLGTLSNRTVRNTYDNANRLTEEVIDLDSNGPADITTSYVYDAGNNRKQKTVTGGANAGVTNYTVNNLNQVVAANGLGGNITYTYDANGNRKTRTKGSQTDTYTYDVENRLIELIKIVPDAGLTTGTFGYVYDYRTRRVERDESQAGGNTTKVVFSGGLSCFEQEGGTRTVEYIRGSNYGGGVGGILYTLRNNTPSYSHYNNRGDVVAKTNGSGALTYQAQYEAFGSRTQEEGSTPDRQKMNTKEEDPTGLVNHGFRYFDLETDTWLTRDPAGFVDGPNLYAYVRQNPWTKFDPEGLFWSIAVTMGFQVYDSYQYATGQIGGAEFATRSALNGVSLVADLGTGGMGGGLVVRGGALALKGAAGISAHAALNAAGHAALEMRDVATPTIVVSKGANDPRPSDEKSSPTESDKETKAKAENATKENNGEGTNKLSSTNYPNPDPPMSAPAVQHEPATIDEVMRMRQGKGPTTRATHGTGNIEAHHRQQVPTSQGGVVDELTQKTHRGAGNHTRHNQPSSLTPSQRSKEVREHWKQRGSEYILPGEGI